MIYTELLTEGVRVESLQSGRIACDSGFVVGNRSCTDGSELNLACFSCSISDKVMDLLHHWNGFLMPSRRRSVASVPLDLSQRLQKHFAKLLSLVREFHTHPLTPAATFAFEKK